MPTGPGLLRRDARFRVPLLLAALTTLTLTVPLYLRAKDGAELERRIERLIRLRAYGNELRFTSHALTRMSRSYVIGSDPRFRDMFEEIVDVRNGDRPRPREGLLIYWDHHEFDGSPQDMQGERIPLLALLARDGALPDEIALLARSKEASDELVVIERTAMDQAAHLTPLDTAARALVANQLYDPEYMRAKAAVMGPIAEFIRTVDTRAIVDIERMRARIATIDHIIAGTALVLLGCLLATWRGFTSIVGEPLDDFFTRIRGLLPEGSAALAIAGARGRQSSLADTLGSVTAELEARGAQARQLLAEVSAHEKRQRDLIEHAPVALALFDRGMRYLAWSRRWSESYGLGERDLLGLSHYEIFPDLPDVWKEAHRRGMAGETLRANEDRYARADGSVYYLRWELTPWHAADGSIGGIVVMTEDVTPGVVQRQQLATWTRAFEQARLGVAIIDRGEPWEPRIREVNPHLAQMLGHTPESLRGRTVMSLVPEALQGAMQATLPELESTRHVSFESELLTATGGTLPVLLDITTEPDETGRQRRVAFVMPLVERNRLMGELARNVSELRRSNQSLLEARDEALAATHTRSAILSNLSHELRTPLNHILGFSALLDTAALDERARQRVRRISESGSALSRLVDNLLEAARAESSGIRLEEEVFPLSAVLDEVARSAAIALGRKGMRLDIDVAPDMPARLCGDPRHLAHALSELVDNAIKFSDAGVVNVSVKRALQPEDPPRMVFEVEDHGQGIPVAQREELFSWFRQGDDSSTRQHGGVGVGLALVRRIAALMGGEAGYRAGDAGGSVFRLELPLVQTQTPEPAALPLTSPDVAAGKAWLSRWHTELQGMEMGAAGEWKSRPADVDTLLAHRLGAVDLAVRNFDFDVAAELVSDALEAA